jgi:hypothetical protein
MAAEAFADALSGNYRLHDGDPEQVTPQRRIFMKTTSISSFVTVLLFALAPLSIAQTPVVNNAKLQQLSAAGGLKAAIDSVAQKQSTPAWVGYKIPAVAKERTMCCFDSTSDFNGARNGGKCCMGCKMESEKGGNFFGTVSDCSPPEPYAYAFVFYRLEDKQVRKVRVYSPDCALDFNNLPLYWLDNVNPAQSVELLTELALAASPEGEGKKDSSSRAIQAIAMHDDASADATLEKLIQPGNPSHMRKNVAFWLGNERGKRGWEILHKYAKTDSDDSFRAHATFAFSQSKEPGALEDLISMAHNDPSTHVRGQAIFWMSQLGGRKLASQITDAIENDPDTGVKKKAVFALSQLHDGEGVPMLISVAKTNRNPAVRKQAIFWLGQSRDPRALEYLEQILTK